MIVFPQKWCQQYYCLWYLFFWLVKVIIYNIIYNIYIYTHLYLELMHFHRVILTFPSQWSIEWKRLLCYECFPPIKTSGIYKYFDIKIVSENNQTITPGDLYVLHQVENKNLKLLSKSPPKISDFSVSTKKGEKM